MNKLYIGNLSWTVGDEQLERCFSQAGKVVAATVILDRDTGRSRGFGFVEMATPEEAERAIQTLDGTYLEGRKIIIREAKPEGEHGNDPYKSISAFVNFKSKPKDRFQFQVRGKQFTLIRDE